MMLRGERDQTGLPIVGSVECSLDSKNRVLLPKDIRERLGREFAMWLGDFGCVYACSGASWATLLGDLQSVPANNAGRRIYHAMTYRFGVDNVLWDDQGSVTIPETLRQEAKIVRNVHLYGNLEHLEIWASEEWDAFLRDPARYNLARVSELERAKTWMNTSPRSENAIDAAIRQRGSE